MGQYYKAYVRDAQGNERGFNPQNAIYMTANGLRSDGEIGRKNWDDSDPKSWGHCFSGMKLTEHSWMGNDFVNGVLEAIWSRPSAVAWIGDYADPSREYELMWCDGGLPEVPFESLPDIHRDGYLVNRSKGVYVDLAEYAEKAAYEPSWAKGESWCIHPLPILTAVGNGRGGGDYHGACMGMVGAWAFDEIEYTRVESKLGGLERVDAARVAFMEE